MTEKTKKQQVKEVAWRLFEESGQIPSVREIQDALGGGSLRDISAELSSWKSDLAALVKSYRHRPGIPDPVWSAMQSVWEEALRRATEIARKELEDQREEARSQVEQANVARQKAEKLAAAREAEAEKLTKELGETNERWKGVVLQLNLDLDKLREELESSKEEVAEWKRKYADQEKIIASQAKDLAVRDETVARLVEQNRKIEEEKRSFVDSLRSEHDSEISRLESSYDAERSRLMVLLDQERQNAKRLQKRVEELILEKGSLSAAAAESRTEIGRLEEYVSTMKAEHGEAKALLEKLLHQAELRVMKLEKRLDQPSGKRERG